MVHGRWPRRHRRGHLPKAAFPAEQSSARVLLADDKATSGPRLEFHRVRETKVVKNRLHLDLISDSFDTDTERLESLGAKKLRDVQVGNARWTTFADIEGNEFDLIAG
jgi:glyoxalase superfamily protein